MNLRQKFVLATLAIPITGEPFTVQWLKIYIHAFIPAFLTMSPIQSNRIAVRKWRLEEGGAVYWQSLYGDAV
ncbi:hypothetical protein DEU56DRAFT_836273, partial [Suillus clintonianus]|uniref:uncharacterized protein n=1 Tax=Suillus clintonianus TaxID=1904413 RepID=UPI001B87C5F9